MDDGFFNRVPDLWDPIQQETVYDFWRCTIDAETDKAYLLNISSRGTAWAPKPVVEKINDKRVKIPRWWMDKTEFKAVSRNEAKSDFRDL